MEPTDKIVDSYIAIRPVYVAFAGKLKDLIETLLENKRIDYSQIEARAKTAESFKQKVNTKGDKYNSPLDDITDLCGLRIICYYQEDIEPIADALAEIFEVDREHSIDKSHELAANEFGYDSKHLIVAIKPERGALLDWQPFSKFRAEVQIRSVLQHAWAAVDHKLNYKRKDEAPRPLRRRLSRLAALIELADEQFSTVRREAHKLERVNNEDVRAGNLDIELDLSSLTALLQEDSELVGEIRNIFREFKWRIKTARQVGVTRETRDRSDLLQVARDIGCETVGELKAKLTLSADELRRIMRVLDSNSRINEKDNYTHGTIEDMLTALLLVINGSEEAVQRAPYVDDFKERVIQTIDELR